MPRSSLPAIACALFLSLRWLWADVPLPQAVLEPATIPEAWNVIRLATGNLETLLAEKRADEIATQVSLCSPALRTLVRLAPTAEVKWKLDRLVVQAFSAINATATGGLENDLLRAQAGYGALRRVLDKVQDLFDPETQKAEIYYCPVHPETVSTDPEAKCEKCGERFVVRRIAYSFIYTAQGEPTLRATAAADAPLEAGRKTTVRLTLAHPDGRPVALRELLIEHTQRIHVLLVDSSLTDFHRTHPQATDTPGEYTFAFTPRLTAPYRLWLDVTPAATGLAEFPTSDLASAGAGEGITPLGDDRTTTVEGISFQLSFDDRQGLRPRARETRLMRLTVTDAAGAPVKNLAPYLDGFAYLTGFYDDGRTLVRLHPEGGPILREDLRGGPVLGFRFFPPKAGRIRFFCEVVMEGKRIVAPIDVGVSP